MHNGYKVVDVHGHMTTPAGFRQFLAEIVSQNTPGRKLEMTDEQLENAQQRHLKFMDDRNIDIQLIGPRPIAMWHWMRPFLQEFWAKTTNDVIARIVKLHPDRFRGMAQLPQYRDKDTRNCLPEFERCVKELGFVGAYLNPDPAGDKQTPGVHEEYWYPLYEKADRTRRAADDSPIDQLRPAPGNYSGQLPDEQLSRRVRRHAALFAQQCLRDFSQAKNYHLPLRRRTRIALFRPINHVGQGDSSKNLFYDSCVYDEHYLEAAIKQRGVDQMLFGTESPGSGGAVRPETGKPSDDHDSGDRRTRILERRG